MPGETSMAKDYSTLPRTRMRRSECAVGDEERIKALLQPAPGGVFATVHAFLNTNLLFLW
jgi:hypothetical protein